MAPCTAELLAPWDGADVVPFPALATRAGLSRDARRELLDSGVIRPVNDVTRGKTPLITWEDAAMFAAAALLALAAGLAVVTVLRVLCQTGAKIGADGVQIPVPGP